MTLFWSRYGDWEPQGGEHKAWLKLERGDLIQSDRKLWSVIEVRPVPVIDWDDHDREAYERHVRHHRNPRFVPLATETPRSEEEWHSRPLYLIVVPAGGGKRHHTKVCPYAGLFRGAYVISPHHPVCRDCGELWPCREVEITQEVQKQAAVMQRYEQVLPSCCWSCGEPVTGRQGSVTFDGDNLLLLGAPPPVFHLRRKCRSSAMAYEKRWIAAEEGRRWRLQCPGKQIRHVDGDECSEDPFCPGKVSHNTFISHVYGRLPDGTVRSAYGSDFRCCRCEDALVQRVLAIGEPPPGALL